MDAGATRKINVHAADGKLIGSADVTGKRWEKLGDYFVNTEQITIKVSAAGVPSTVTETDGAGNILAEGPFGFMSHFPASGDTILVPPGYFRL